MAAGLPAPASSGDAGEPVLREQRSVRVQGAKEVWQLVWEGKPSAVCGPEEGDIAITCPCSGLAYGEYGKLFLVRNRDGREIERLDLGPLFGKAGYLDADQNEGAAYVQRWPWKIGDFDRQARDDPTLLSDIERRPAPLIMRLADYDRDGEASEFLIQVGTLPCGKWQFAALGVSAKQPHLHALASAANPDTPLIMPLNAWQALLKGPGPHTVTTWACNDHGSEVRTELVVSASHGEIHVKNRTFSCPENGQAEKLLSEDDL